MTFKVDRFSVPKLEERLTDLIEQDIFKPRMILIDGLPFDAAAGEQLVEMKAMAEKYAFHAWFAVTTHRHEAPGPGGLPNQLKGIDHLFEKIIQLAPDGKEIHVNQFKGVEADAVSRPLVLDPSTMLLVEHA
jgi:hypothetical protein